MGLCDFDDQIYAERDLLDWAKSRPSSPGSYEQAPTEEAQAAYDHELREWANKKPDTGNGYGDR